MTDTLGPLGSTAYLAVKRSDAACFQHSAGPVTSASGTSRRSDPGRAQIGRGELAPVPKRPAGPGWGRKFRLSASRIREQLFRAGPSTSAIPTATANQAARPTRIHDHVSISTSLNRHLFIWRDSSHFLPGKRAAMPMRAALFAALAMRDLAAQTREARRPGFSHRGPATTGAGSDRYTVSSVKDMTEQGAQQLAGEVLAAISALRRVARRAARSAWPAQPLPSAQSELLRLAASRPGISVTEAAADLRLAPNTVSTLVGRLAAAGLLERARALSDGRSIRLTVTASGAQRIAEWRDLRAGLAGQALSLAGRRRPAGPGRRRPRPAPLRRRAGGRFMTSTPPSPSEGASTAVGSPGRRCCCRVSRGDPREAREQTGNERG